MKALLAVCVLLLLSLGVGCGQEGAGCQAWMPSSFQDRLGGQAPDFTLATLSDPEQKITLSETAKNHTVLIAFWATWCPSCVEEIPLLNSWNDQYTAKGLRILGVNVQEPRGRVLEFEQGHSMNYPILLDENGDVANRFGLVGLPASVMLAKGGEIIYYGFGLPENIEELIY